MKRTIIILTIMVLHTLSAISQEPPIEGALEFDSTKGHHVNHGFFWKVNENLGPFFWEAWVKPYADAQYIISDGYGGAHALLFGFSGGSSKLKLTGNIWNGDTNTPISFGTDEGVSVNEWCHVAVAWDGNNIVTYLNGVPSGVVPYNGTRKTVSSAGAGVLFIGGSNHSNFNGKIARVRGFEDNLPFDNLFIAFTPEKYFRSSYVKTNGDIVSAAFIADYSQPSKFYQDYSSGYRNSNHVGILSKGTDGGNFGKLPVSAPTAEELPVWKNDPIQPPVNRVPESKIPANVLVYDSFSRLDSVPAFGGDGLGSVEHHPGRTKAEGRWRGTREFDWGILQGKAFNGGGDGRPVYVDTTVTNMEVKARRSTGAFSTGHIGLVYRYIDDANFGTVYTSGSQIYLVEFVNGAYAKTAVGLHPSQYWNELRIVANGTSVKVYCSGVQIISIETPNLGSGTKAGMIAVSGSVSRMDEFSVFRPQ